MMTYIIMISVLDQSILALYRGDRVIFNMLQTDFSLKVHLTQHQLLLNWDLYFLFSINMEMNTGVLCRKISLSHTNWSYSAGKHEKEEKLVEKKPNHQDLTREWYHSIMTVLSLSATWHGLLFVTVERKAGMSPATLFGHEEKAQQMSFETLSLSTVRTSRALSSRKSSKSTQCP